ncbi:phosphate ABC transporter permease PstA [Spiroplasma endosymbiont of Crioceris asparagi]|uniref:phosphate ABC transporter permease PstA n=1 Tax=Spiroplasma endosymbiont of Crioceris asparagi TaxID=3066286 RepID=UPI0030CCCB48
MQIKNWFKTSGFKKSKNDGIFKLFLISITSFVLLFLTLIILFIFIKSIHVFKEVKIWKFIFSDNWNPGKDNSSTATYGILGIIISTIVMLAFALIIAIPLTIFSSLYICEYMSERGRRIIITITQLLAGIPSVVFGLFAVSHIGNLMVSLGAKTPGNLMTASVTLAFMSLPTMITLSVNGIAAVPESYRFASIGLGISKEATTMKIIFKSALPKIITAIVMGMARIIGETMAVILVAGNSAGGLNTSNGFGGFIFSSLRTLSGTIGIEILENSGKTHESALYAIGLILFIVIIIINLIVLSLSRMNAKKSSRISARKKSHKNYQHWTYKYKRLIINKKKLGLDEQRMSLLMKTSGENKLSKTMYSWFYKILMLTSLFIIVAFTLWIIFSIIFNGVAGFQFSAFNSISGSGSQDGIISTILVTILLVITTMIFALPLALFSAIYFNEYANKKAFFTKFLRFAINILASTPSIVFGIFGLTLFLITMHIPMSVLAAGLTMTMVVLPTLIITFEDGLSDVPMEYREAAYGMGIRKIKVIFLIILPSATRGIVTGTILTISRIIGESAPVYLTLGTTVRMPSEGLLSPGATLTTKIYMLASEGTGNNSLGIAYQMSLIIILIIFGLNWLSRYLAEKLDPLKKPIPVKERIKLAQQRIERLFSKNTIISINKWFIKKSKSIKLLFNHNRNKTIIKNAKERKKIIKTIIEEEEDDNG